uniref:ETS domain-containing protein n=1 Tax=Schistocephalus solidus TaxID=70667 RepID=A0A0X3PPN3_SCHSO
MSSYLPFAVSGLPCYYPHRSTGELAADPVLTDATSSNLFIEDGLPILGAEKSEDEISCDAESQATSPKLYRLPSENSDFSLVSGNHELITFNELQLEREADWQRLDFPVNPLNSCIKRRLDRSHAYLGRSFSSGRRRRHCFEAAPNSSSLPTLPPDFREAAELPLTDENYFDSGISSLHLSPTGTDRSYHSPSSSLSLSTDSAVCGGGYGSDEIANPDDNPDAEAWNLVEFNCRTGSGRVADNDPWLAENHPESNSSYRSADFVLLQQRWPPMPAQRRTLQWPAPNDAMLSLAPSTSAAPSASRRKQPILYSGPSVSSVTRYADLSRLKLPSKHLPQVTPQRVYCGPGVQHQMLPKDFVVGGCESGLCNSCLEDRSALYERLTEGSVTQPGDYLAFSKTRSSIAVSPQSVSPASSPPSSASSSTSPLTLGLPFGPVCRTVPRPLQPCSESYCWSHPPTAARARKACLRGLASVNDCSLFTFEQTDSSSDYEIEAENFPHSRRPMHPPIVGGHPFKRTPRPSTRTPLPSPPHGAGGLTRRRTIGFTNGERPYHQESARSHYNQYMRNRARGRGRRRHLLSFILDLLAHRHNCVEWVSKTDKVFQIVNPEQLTRLWGEYKNNKKMSFESLSRSLRLYYAPGKLERISGLRHHYRLLYSSALISSEAEGLCNLPPHFPATRKRRSDCRHDNNANAEWT